MNTIARSVQLPDPHLTLIDLGRRTRAAAGADELAFILVNDTLALAPYRQAALWFDPEGVRTLSGVVQLERNAPYLQYLNRLCRELADRYAAETAPQPVDRHTLSPEVAEEWAEWLPAELLWLPIPARPDDQDSVAGGLLLAGDKPFSEQQLVFLAEWLDVWRYAWMASVRPGRWSLALARKKFQQWRQQYSQEKWWRRRPVQVAAGLVLLLFFPVRLTVLASGELVPANPAVIRAPLDGVIGQFHVRPNEQVKAGQLLFTFDDAPIASRVEVARQGLATAEAEYRQFAQLALSDVKSKGQLAILLGKIAEKRAEVEFLESQYERSRVVAPQAGLALFDDPSEWIGRPVQTGERVLRVATPTDVEIEAWVPIGDAIPLPEKAQVSLYLAASPFSAIAGHVRYLSHEAVPRPDGIYAYRVRAALDENSKQRIGLKGTAKLHGHWVPLCYWVLRRPLATIRQFLAI